MIPSNPSQEFIEIQTGPYIKDNKTKNTMGITKAPNGSCSGQVQDGHTQLFWPHSLANKVKSQVNSP